MENKHMSETVIRLYNREEVERIIKKVIKKRRKELVEDILMGIMMSSLFLFMLGYWLIFGY